MKKKSFEKMMRDFKKESAYKNNEVKKRNNTKLEGKKPLYERKRK